jgi:hypothetical protein
MNCSNRACAAFAALLALLGPAAALANTVFEIDRDTVHEGKWPDTVYVANLTGDTIVLDSVFVLLDTSRFICCDVTFRVNDSFYGYAVTANEPEELSTALSVYPGGPIRIPGGGARKLYLFRFMPCGPSMDPLPVPDTIHVVLVFAIAGERDTLVVVREAGTGVERGRDQRAPKPPPCQRCDGVTEVSLDGRAWVGLRFGSDKTPASAVLAGHCEGAVRFRTRLGQRRQSHD